MKKLTKFFITLFLIFSLTACSHSLKRLEQEVEKSGADAKVSALDEATTASGTDVVYTVVGGVSKKITVSNLFMMPVPIVTTGDTATISATYTYNNNATSGNATTYTLPAAKAGAGHCVRNIAGRTGALRLNVAGTEQIDLGSTASGAGGYITSGVANGNSICVIAASTDLWVGYVQSGIWTAH